MQKIFSFSLVFVSISTGWPARGRVRPAQWKFFKVGCWLYLAQEATLDMVQGRGKFYYSDSDYELLIALQGNHSVMIQFQNFSKYLERILIRNGDYHGRGRMRILTMLEIIIVSGSLLISQVTRSCMSDGLSIRVFWQHWNVN